MLDYLKKRPMLLSAICASLLIVICFYFENASVFIGAAIIAIIFVMIICKTDKGIIFSALCVGIIMINVQINLISSNNTKYLSGMTVSGDFCVTENSKNKGSYSTVICETKNCEKINRGTKIFMIYSGNENLLAGDIIKGDVKLKSNDGSKYKADNYSEKIYLSASLSNEDVVGQDVVLSRITKIREYISNTIFSNLSNNESATINALVTGDKSYLSTDFLNLVRRSGISHVLVVSGMHLSIIMTFVLGLFEHKFYNKYLKALIIFLTTIFVIAVCGFTMSIIRAGVTYILIAISILIGRDTEGANILGLAVTLILSVSPFAVLSLSFQLSVLSTFGVLVVSPMICENVNPISRIKNRVIKQFVTLAVSSLSAMLMTFPVVINSFSYVSVVSVFTNLLISSAVTLDLILVFCALIISCIFGWMAKPFFLVSGLITKYVNYVVKCLGNLNYATIDLDKSYALISVFVILIVMEALITCKKRKYMLRLKYINSQIKQ